MEAQVGHQVLSKPTVIAVDEPAADPVDRSLAQAVESRPDDLATAMKPA